MKQKVLLVEDDKNISDSLSSYLRDEGFDVLTTSSLVEARTTLSSAPSIMVLDWMLPDGQGLDFLKDLRRENITLPIIMLTARAELVDKVLGLESGANDYLTKPFEPRELVARIRAHLRSGTPTSKTKTIMYNGIEVDQQQRIVQFQKQSVDLTKLEFDLLVLLIEEPGRVFTREEILNKVWGYERFPTTRTVDNHIVQLRQKINPYLFESVRGVGYRIIT